jgi:hypothetical protein
MNQKKTVLVGILLLNALTAYASGNGAGNGGDVVACFKGGMDQTIAKRARKFHDEHISQDPIGADGMAALTKAPELLDLYELRNSTNLETGAAKLVAKPANYRAGVLDAYTRAANTNYVFYDKYLRAPSTRLPIKKFSLVPNGVVEVDDSNSVIKLHTGCLLLQIAIQTHINNDVKVTIDGRLFNRMGSLDQTALITHEQILNQSMGEEGDTYSDRARGLNGTLYRADFLPGNAMAVNSLLEPLMQLGKNLVITCRSEGICGFTNFGQPYALNSHGTGVQSETAGLSGFPGVVAYPKSVEYLGFSFSGITWGNEKDGVFIYPYVGNVDLSASTQIPADIRGWGEKMNAQFGADETTGAPYVDSLNMRLENFQSGDTEGVGGCFGANYKIANVTFRPWAYSAPCDEVEKDKAHVHFSPDFSKFTVSMGTYPANHRNMRITIDGVVHNECDKAEFTLEGDRYTFKCVPR